MSGEIIIQELYQSQLDQSLTVGEAQVIWKQIRYGLHKHGQQLVSDQIEQK